MILPLVPKAIPLPHRLRSEIPEHPVYMARSSQSTCPFGKISALQSRYTMHNERSRLTGGVGHVALVVAHILVSSGDALEAVGAALGLGRVLAYAVPEAIRG